ncbi:hypothetical protein EBR25_09960 [bacterium]|nr:hypothetical protein [bacterium]
MFLINSAIQAYLHECMMQPPFKRMLYRIVKAQEQSEFRSLAIISDENGEEKSLFALAFGMSYAAFLRRRVLFLSFCQSLPGRNDYPLGTVPVRDEIVGEPNSWQKTDFQVLFNMNSILARNISNQEKRSGVLPSTYPVSTEFLLREFLKEKEDKFDLIVIDTQELSRCSAKHSDPIIIAAQTDRTIFLLKKGQMPKRTQTRITEAFQNEQINNLGAIIVDMNDANESHI